jgi:hypothetical protein
MRDIHKIISFEKNRHAVFQADMDPYCGTVA